MRQQPMFDSPVEAIEFIRMFLNQHDAEKLYTAFSEKTSEFWRGRLLDSLRQIEETETLKRVFLEGGQINSFPEGEPFLNLGGHDPRSRYIHLKLVKTTHGWVLESIHVC